MAVFVERTLTARKGKKRVTLRLRVSEPRGPRNDMRSTIELRAGRTLVSPRALATSGIGGADSWQTVVLALRNAAFMLVLFERDTGMQIDVSDWVDIVDLLAPMPIPAEMRARVAQIERTIERAMQELREAHDDHDHDHDRPRRRRKR